MVKAYLKFKLEKSTGSIYSNTNSKPIIINYNGKKVLVSPCNEQLIFISLKSGNIIKKYSN